MNKSLMRKGYLIFVFCWGFSFVFSQQIENLKTNKETAKFLSKYINKKYTFKYVFDKEKEIDREDFEDYVKKIDLDKNGFIDLVVNYYEPIFVLNFGNQNYKEVKLKKDNNYGLRPELEKIINLNGQEVLIFKTEVNGELYSTAESRETGYKTDSLIIKFGQFLSYKKNPSKPESKIRNIKFTTSGCFGTCPAYELQISSSGNYFYNGIKFTKIVGKKKGELNQKDLQELFGLINYADIINLENHYSVLWTDDQTGILTVEFENGKTKEIVDYGLNGNTNLRAAYYKLFEIYYLIQKE
jgi:hypothetical protein